MSNRRQTCTSKQVKSPSSFWKTLVNARLGKWPKPQSLLLVTRTTTSLFHLYFRSNLESLLPAAFGITALDVLFESYRSTVSLQPRLLNKNLLLKTLDFHFSLINTSFVSTSNFKLNHEQLLKHYFLDMWKKLLWLRQDYKGHNVSNFLNSMIQDFFRRIFQLPFQCLDHVPFHHGETTF